MKFKVGDIVRATKQIRRRDGRSDLQVGDKAKIINVWQSSDTSPQIVTVQPDGKPIIGDIVLTQSLLEHVAKKLRHVELTKKNK